MSKFCNHIVACLLEPAQAISPRFAWCVCTVPVTSEQQDPQKLYLSTLRVCDDLCVDAGGVEEGFLGHF